MVKKIDFSQRTMGEENGDFFPVILNRMEDPYMMYKLP